MDPTQPRQPNQQPQPTQQPPTNQPPTQQPQPQQPPSSPSQPLSPPQTVRPQPPPQPTQTDQPQDEITFQPPTPTEHDQYYQVSQPPQTPPTPQTSPPPQQQIPAQTPVQPPNQPPIQPWTNQNQPAWPDQTTSAEPIKKTNYTLWIIIGILIIAGAIAAYFFTIGSGKKVTITGNKENMTIKIPKNYETKSKKEAGFDITYIYDPKIIKTPDNIPQNESEKTIAAFHFQDNSSNDAKKEAEKFKKLFEEIKKRPNADIKITTDSNKDYEIVRCTCTGDVSVTGSYSHYLTEAVFITSKSVFMVLKLNPKGDKSYNAEVYDQIIKSVKIKEK